MRSMVFGLLNLFLFVLQFCMSNGSRWRRFVVPTVQQGRPQMRQSEDDMIYHLGSPVLTGDVNVYNIYYGNVIFKLIWFLQKHSCYLAL
jgi:hypothetical protein